MRWPNEGDANGEPVTTFWKTEPRIDTTGVCAAPDQFADPSLKNVQSAQARACHARESAHPARLRLDLDSRLSGNDTLIEFDPFERVPILASIRFILTETPSKSNHCLD
jgi:hypothetical protein